MISLLELITINSRKTLKNPYNPVIRAPNLPYRSGRSYRGEILEPFHWGVLKVFALFVPSRFKRQKRNAQFQPRFSQWIKLDLTVLRAWYTVLVKKHTI